MPLGLFTRILNFSTCMKFEVLTAVNIVDVSVLGSNTAWTCR
jgi:hypothetical protein